MTPAQIKHKIKSDPYYFLSIIVQNNPEAVANNLDKIGGYTVLSQDPETLFMYLDDLWHNNREKALQVINVPINWNQLPGEYAQALIELKQKK